MRKTIFALVLIFVLVFPQIQFAQMDGKELRVIAPPTVVTENKVDYQLPYPGLLPDNPLYPLKALRDKLVGFFITDPLKKAQLNLLDADKRLNGAFYLFNSAKSDTVQNPTKQNEKKINLAISTISKAENYFGESIEKVREAKKQGMDTKNILRTLEASSKKHQEIVQSLEKQTPILKEEFGSLEKRIVDFRKEVEALKSL